MAFKAEELTTQIFPYPETGLWAAGGCQQDTLVKGKPCQNTQCQDKTHPPCGDNTEKCTEDTIPPGHPGKRNAAGRADLLLLQAQLRERLAQA